jgi:predicted nuclease of predicted toxin-antitoxin system
MKFLADMGISPGIVFWLRNNEHDAVHLHDEGLGRLADIEVLEKARIENRIVLTHDLDFGELMAFSHQKQPSVIIFRLRDMRPVNVQKYLGEIIENHDDLFDDGIIASVTERRIRIRRLPI